MKRKNIRDGKKLEDLEGVGKACMMDFALLGIKTVKELSKKNPDLLYAELNRRSGIIHDICALDVLRCAVAQAKDPLLPKAKRKWWYWSKKRKELDKK